MTLEEAMAINDRLLPGEPGGDEIARWQACRPQPEPARQQRGLDTAPAPQVVDWALVIRQALLGERAHMTEAIGEALGEHGNKLLDESRDDDRGGCNQLRAEHAEQLDQLRAQIDLAHTQGAELRAELENIIAKRKRAKAAKANGEARPLLQLPNPNGDATHSQ
jgi:chorismate mutase